MSTTGHPTGQPASVVRTTDLIDYWIRRQVHATDSSEATRAMSVAFDGVCRALGVSYTANGAREAIATKIIELARRGECDPDRLRDRVITEAANGNVSAQPRL